MNTPILSFFHLLMDPLLEEVRRRRGSYTIAVVAVAASAELVDSETDSAAFAGAVEDDAERRVVAAAAVADARTKLTKAVAVEE